jgi:hypothetical protein
MLAYHSQSVYIWIEKNVLQGITVPEVRIDDVPESSSTHFS